MISLGGYDTITIVLCTHNALLLMGGGGPGGTCYFLVYNIFIIRT